MKKFVVRLLLLAAFSACLGAAQAQSLDLGIEPGAAAAPGLSAPSSGDSDGIAAVVGDQVITRYDLALRARTLEQRLAQQPGQAAAMPHGAQLRAAGCRR